MALAAAAARAQPPQVEAAFARRTVEQALRESIEKKRILVIFLNAGTPAHRLVEQNTLPNRTLEAWMLWHGVGVNLDRTEDPRGYAFVTHALRAGGFRVPFETFPTFVMFKDGKFVRSYPDATFHGFLWEATMIGGPPSAETFYPKVTQVLFNLDFLMEKLAATDPIWTLAHTEKNPVPERPAPPPPLFAEDDGLAVPIEEPAPGSDPLTLLEDARGSLKDGAFSHAIGLYTYLYERGQTLEPALRPALLSFIAEDAAELVRTEPQARRRIEALRQRLGDRFLWWQYPDFVEWMALTEIVAAEGENITLLLSVLHDEQEATMLPRAELAAFNSIIELDRFTRPSEVTREDLDYFRKVARATDSAKPVSAPAAEWAEAIAFRRSLVIDYGCRLYAALLLKGREREATDIAAVVIAKGGNPGLARLSLVTTALAARVPYREQFAAWAREAAEHGQARPWLTARLAR